MTPPARLMADLAAFTATAAAWEDAWHRRAATRGQRALLAVATDPDREALPMRRAASAGRRVAVAA